jgi:hypothetical protein
MQLERHHHSLVSSLDLTDAEFSNMLSAPVAGPKASPAAASSNATAPQKLPDTTPPASPPADGASPPAASPPASPPADGASASPPSNSTIAGAGAANGTIPATLPNTTAGNGSASADGGDADEIAAESDAEKAAILTKYAKQKVADLIGNLKSLDTHVKDQFAALETVLNNVEITAEFDPESSEDIAWITTEITKILEDTPEIAALEDKLGMVKDTEPVLKTVITNLKKVTNVSTMLYLKNKNQDEALPPKKNKTNASNDTAPATNVTVPTTAPAAADSPPAETAAAPAAPAETAAPADPAAATAA